MIDFLWPWVFFVLPLPLLIIWILPAATQQEAALQVPFYNTILGLTTDSPMASRRSIWKRLLLVLIWLALILAGSRPQFIGEAVHLPVSGRDLMLSVDISGSMGTDDMELNGSPSTRLQVVKQVVGDFVERRKGDRIGLILFGTNAYLQTPLTFDRNTVRTLLTETPLRIAGEKTAIGDAIGLAVKRLHSRPAENRVLILLTDGASNAGEVSPLQAAKLAKKEGIKIHTIGFGSDQLRVRRGLFQGMVNPSAELDEKTLKEIARLTGGTFQRARSSRELESIYGVLDRLEPVEQEEETYRPVKSLFFWPLGFAFITSLLLALSLFARRIQKFNPATFSPEKWKTDKTGDNLAKGSIESGARQS